MIFYYNKVWFKIITCVVYFWCASITVSGWSLPLLPFTAFSQCYQLRYWGASSPWCATRHRITSLVADLQEKQKPCFWGQKPPAPGLCHSGSPAFPLNRFPHTSFCAAFGGVQTFAPADSWRRSSWPFLSSLMLCSHCLPPTALQLGSTDRPRHTAPVGKSPSPQAWWRAPASLSPSPTELNLG